MYRKIMDYLKEWKHSEHRKPLIPWGYPVCFKSVCVSSKVECGAPSILNWNTFQVIS